MERAAPRAAALGWEEQVLLPLDRARAAINRAVLGTRLGAPLVRKDTRVGLRGVAGVGVALALTLRAPLFLFALAPVVLGVPHLAADLRYLVLAPRWSRAVRAALLAGCAPFVLLRLLPLIGVGVPRGAAWEMGLATALLGVAAVLAARRARRLDRLLVVLPVGAAVGALAVRHADGARLVLAHAHNVIALVVWAWLFRARRGDRRALWLPLAFVAAATLLVVAYGWAHAPSLAATRAFGVRLGDAAAWLAPGLPARAGVAIALSYVLLQSVHYSVWLGLIPTEAVRGDAARSFRMSVRALRRDFGGPGLLAIVAVAVGTLAFAASDLTRTRETYLTLSAFHGYLELAALVIALCGPRLWRPAQAP